MGDRTSIEWTATYHADGTVTPGASWNPVRGCRRKSPGCENCYAEREALRSSGEGRAYEGLVVMTNNGPRWTGKVRFVESQLTKPLSWRAPRKIFVCSMSDLFYEEMEASWQVQVFAVMALAERHTFLVLTKRPDIMQAFIADPETPNLIAGAIELSTWAHLYGTQERRREICEALRSGAMWPLPNVWCGTSVENQEMADERIPFLIETPATVRFLSAEPLIGSIDLTRWVRPIDHCSYCGAESDPSDADRCAECGQEGYMITTWGEAQAERMRSRERYDEDSVAGRADIDGHPIDALHWVIVGGESGPKSRPMHPGWVRVLRDQCVAAGVPFLFKQWGSWIEHSPSPGGDLGGDMRRGKVRIVKLKGENDGHLVSGDVFMRRTSKKKAGRILDGREWNEMPEVQG